MEVRLRPGTGDASLFHCEGKSGKSNGFGAGSINSIQPQASSNKVMISLIGNGGDFGKRIPPSNINTKLVVERVHYPTKFPHCAVRESS